MLEVKASNELTNTEVLEKARAAREWCAEASAHARATGNKPWRYALIAHDLIAVNQNLASLAP